MAIKIFLLSFCLYIVFFLVVLNMKSVGYLQFAFLLFPVGLFLLIYGVVLLRASKYRKTGIMLIILFLAIALMAQTLWMVDSRLEECRLLGIKNCLG